MRVIAIIGRLAACGILAGLTACGNPSPHTATKAARVDISSRIASAPGRALPSPLYGVTIDDVSHAGQIAAALRNLPKAPTARIYFDVTEPAGYYTAAVSALRPVSYLMGELLDSADETRIATSAYKTRVRSYLAAFRGKIDVWEIGNEVNGNWTGRYPAVAAKLTEAYREVTAAGKRAALTLYYNIGCGDDPAELSPVAFSRAYVPRAVRDGLRYVLLSYYPDACHGLRPGAGAWTAYFKRLHVLYPHAMLGFGEIGLKSPAAPDTLRAARALIHYYYGLVVRLPYFAGGYFWWYFTEDCLPYASKPLWAALGNGFQAEAAAWGQRPG
jgi:hypothetical protein